MSSTHKTNGFVGRIEIDPHDVAQIVDKVQIVRQLEPGDAVRLEPMPMPNVADGLLTDALCAKTLATAESLGRAFG